MPQVTTISYFQRVCQQLGVPDEYVYYFGLFLLQKKRSTSPVSSLTSSSSTGQMMSNDGLVVARRLQDFESPYISQKASSEELRLVLKKCSWDPVIDQELMSNKVGRSNEHVQNMQF